MRYTRQNRILELIKTNDIETQQQLADMLNKEGFDVTQATVSRDIKSIRLVKQNKNGKSCYALPVDTVTSPHEKFKKIMKDTVLSVDFAENIIVIKTLSGCAGPAAEAIDMQKFSDILGTLAGDNTIFIAVKSKDAVEYIINEIKKVLA